MLKLTWYGTASLLFETEDDCFVLDPFLKLLPEGAENEADREARLRSLQRCPNVLLTHGHLDHMGSVATLYAQTDAMIYTTAGPAKNLQGLGFSSERLRVIEPEDWIDIGSCHILCRRGKHILYDKPLLSQIAHRTFPGHTEQLWQLMHLNRQYPEYHETMVYEIQSGGKRILVLGSAELDPETAYPVGTDVLILPHQGRSDITEHNFRLLQALQPREVLIDHYDNAFPPLTSEIDCAPLMELVQDAMPQMAIAKLQEGRPQILVP